MPGISTLLRIAGLSVFLASGAAHAQAPAPAEADAHVELLARYYDLGRRGELDGQVALWARDASNNGERVRADNIRAALEDIRRTFPDYDSVVLGQALRSARDALVALPRRQDRLAPGDA